MRGAISGLLFRAGIACLSLLTALGARCAAETFQVGESSRPVEASWEGWVLRVHSLSLEGGAVTLRLGFLNDSPETRRLPDQDGGVRLTSVPGSLDVPMSWGSEAGADGMLIEPGAVGVREVRGGCPVGTGVPGLPLTLHCPGFKPVTFAVKAGDRLTLARPDGSGRSWALDFEQNADAESLANVPLILREARVKGGLLEVGVAFRNASRFDLEWKSRLSGGDARLWTREGESLRPERVSGGLKDSLGPGLWKRDEEQAGTISFPLPAPEAGQEVTLVFPGYPPVHFVFDAAARQWLVAPRARGSKRAGAAALARAEEALFRELAAYWEGLSTALEKRDFDAYLRAFGDDRGVRADLLAFLGGLGRVPVTWVEFVLPPGQKLTSAGGRVRNLEVELRYGLAGIPRHNEFVTVMQCDLERRLRERTWMVTSMKHRLRPPFWTLGFTEVKSSGHFLVFHKNNATDKNRAESALAQLESGYRHLAGEGVPLGPRYVAFVIPDGGDFQSLTGRNPAVYSGASSATYVERDGELRVINQALFINDFRFFSLQRLMGRQDRQVTIQHELVHLALADQTRPWTPAWLVEGTAVVFGGQMEDIAERAPAEPVPEDIDVAALTQLPTLGVAVRGGDRVLSQYLASARAVQWLLENEGRKALLEFYGSFAGLEPDEWRAGSDGVRRQAVTEPPEMQAARLSLATEMLRRFFPGVGLADLSAAAASAE